MNKIKNLDGDQPPSSNSNNSLTRRRVGRALGSKNPNAGRLPVGRRVKLNERFLLRFFTPEGHAPVEIWKVTAVKRNALVLVRDDKDQAGERIEIAFLPMTNATINATASTTAL